MRSLLIAVSLCLATPTFAGTIPFKQDGRGTPYIGARPPRNHIGCAYDAIVKPGTCRGPGTGMIFLEDPDLVPKGYGPAGCYLNDGTDPSNGWTCHTRERRKS